MTLKVAVQMDHISSINIAGDSAFALMLEAQARGHTLYHYTPDRLAMIGDDVFCALEPVTVSDEKGSHFTLGERERFNMAEMDVVLMRQDPPFDMQYIAATHLLESVHGTGPDQTFCVNHPAYVRNAPEKIFVTEFARFMPPTLISRNPAEIIDFRDEHRDIIVKPLFGNGGAGVFHLKPDDENLTSLLETFLGTSREPVMVQAYLPAIREGDKRIILVDGEAVGDLQHHEAHGQGGRRPVGRGRALDDVGRRTVGAVLGAEVLLEHQLGAAGAAFPGLGDLGVCREGHGGVTSTRRAGVGELCPLMKYDAVLAL